MRKISAYIFIILLSAYLVSAYEQHGPILIEDVHATAEDPYIIEGYEITSGSANCIEVRDSEHIIIRGNHLHDCNWSKDPEDPLSWTEGRAIFVKDSKDIIIEDNNLLRNKIGIFAYKTERVKILKNDIRETQVVGSLKCEYCEDSEIAYNYLLDNGRPDWFWIPGNRIIGIWVAASNDMDIHDNTVIRSSSDGIGISGTIDSSLEDPGKREWTTTADNIRVYNNVLLDNLELGIWLARIRHMKCFNNTIRDHFGPIVLDFDIKDSEFYNNRLVSWGGAPIGIGIAQDNHIYDNIWYATEKTSFQAPPGDKPGVNDIKFRWAGIEPYTSSGNVFEDNEVKVIGGELKQALVDKRRRAEDESIFKEKGWFACEIEEGVLDEECVEKEEAKGNQGMPKDLFIFNPLMEDFEEYIGDGNSLLGKKEKKKEKDNFQKQEGCEECNYTMEKVYAALFFVTFIILMISIAIHIRKRLRPTG